jgi:hypothetical protein
VPSVGGHPRAYLLFAWTCPVIALTKLRGARWLPSKS